jgi:hypothetical protein
VSKPFSFDDPLSRFNRSFFESHPTRDLRREFGSLASSFQIPDFLTEEYRKAFDFKKLLGVDFEKKLRQLNLVALVPLREREQHDEWMRAITGGIDASRYRDLLGLERAASVLSKQFPNHLERVFAEESVRLKAPFKWIDEAAANYKSIFGSLESLFAGQRDEIERLFSAYADIPIKLDDDEFGIGDESVSAEQVRNALEMLCAPSGDGASADENFAKRFASLPGIIRWFVLCVLVPYFVSIIANLQTPYYERMFTDKQVPAPGLKAEIRASGKSAFLGDDARYFRFVTAKQISVRETCRSKAKVVDALNFGKTVKLLRREKDWSVIEYLDDDSERVLQGCVYSRYLAKFE